MNDVTVIGLGAMGATIARLFVEQGFRVTLWNRSAEKADDLVENGAVLAESPAAAIRASSLAIVCVSDYVAADAVLRAPGVANAVAGRVLVQLSTGGPDDARKAEVWAQRHGAQYLDGAIQAAPSQMGRPDTPILLSGNQAAYRLVETPLKVLAENITYLGDKIEAAATMDLGTLSYVYGAIAGFLHGALMTEAEGLDVSRYGQIVNQISPSFGAFFEHEGAVIQSGDFTISESPLRISVEATQRILQSTRAAGLNAEMPAFVTGWFERADAAGLGGEELASLVKVLRRSDHEGAHSAA